MTLQSLTRSKLGHAGTVIHVIVDGIREFIARTGIGIVFNGGRTIGRTTGRRSLGWRVADPVAVSLAIVTPKGVI